MDMWLIKSSKDVDKQINTKNLFRDHFNLESIYVLNSYARIL